MGRPCVEGQLPCNDNGLDHEIAYKSSASVRNVHNASDVALHRSARKEQVDLIIVVACSSISVIVTWENDS